MDTGQSDGFNIPPEQFILPERVTVRDPNGSQYVIERVLGKGEFGAVYLVRERDQKKHVFALKEVINPNKDERERFAFEAEVLKRLDYRALPRVHRVFENASLKRVYLLMDYIEGRNLEDLREEQPGKCFSLLVVRDLMAPIVDALIYLHAQDPPIVHRDIKPANIILPVSGEAMLVDFGSAKEYVPDSTTTMLGHRSPGYAAPEQYRKGTSPATDIYGLGATFYALLTGITPVNAPFRITESWTTGVDPIKPANLLKPEIPVVIAQALQKAMAIAIADRFETVEQLQQALTMHNTRQVPYAATIHKPQTLHPERVSVDSTMQPSQKARPAPISQKEKALRLCAALLIILAIGTGFFSYEWSYNLLLLCSLGVFLLALGGLLISVMMHKLNPRAGRTRYRGHDQ
ncbi:MAG TPA: serine/threonine-protein kinase [Ktedonobacteraceae bacterium]|nr:serine/threonine-protein kinase [Ktedonobacteraceae bacterium]